MWKLLELLEVPSEKEIVNTAVLLTCNYNSVRDYPLEMNHHERTGDSASARKMVYPLSLPRRESSSGTVGGSSSLTASGSASLNSNNLMQGEDYSPPVMIQTPATSSLGTQNPPQSLNIPLQSTLLPQTLPTAVAQTKKKSGFQITSVTPAQTSVSTNNSITEDTESCDDLDESHTEDLSSSEILDVSLSRANNPGGPERSSSEETLNNFHEAETPGAVSPNQPPILTQAHPHSAMVNGTVHHHHQNHGQHPSGKFNPAVAGASGAQIGKPLVPPVTIWSFSGHGPENAFKSGAGMISVASGATISTGNPIITDVCMLNSAGVPALGGISTTSSSVNYSPGLNGISNQNLKVTPIQSGLIGVGITIATTGTTSSAMTSTGGGQVGAAVVGQHAVPASSVPVLNALPQAQVPTPAFTSSRFRVVKLDSTSEPFKKGRWTCTEYYDKEAPITAPSENAPSTRSVESIRQFVPESVVCLERESVSGISVNSSASHYKESLGSGETGGPSAVQQTFQHPSTQMHDYSASNITPMLTQDMHAHLKTNVVAPMSVSIQQQAPANVGGLQTAIGHSSSSVALRMPKLTYAQAAQTSPAQTQQHMSYPPAQQPAAPAQVDFLQSKQIINTVAPGSQTSPQLSASIPPLVVSGNSPLITSQKPLLTPAAQSRLQGLLQPQQTPTPQMIQVSTGGVLPQLVQSGTGLIQNTQGKQLPSQPSLEQLTQISGQGRGAMFIPAVTSNLPTSGVPPNVQCDPQSSVIQNGSKEPGMHPVNQSLLTQPKPTSGECVPQAATARGPEGSSGVNALTASASLLKGLPVDGEEDGVTFLVLVQKVDNVRTQNSLISFVKIDNVKDCMRDVAYDPQMFTFSSECSNLKNALSAMIFRNGIWSKSLTLLKIVAWPPAISRFLAAIATISPKPSSIALPEPILSSSLSQCLSIAVLIQQG
ncbi:TSC22 domain family protein 1 [Triplophysa tibetana]|uniref:TSC22 domain family protein 1 n=1 Tax=Triplophysa tibetana TaxID=1572043 RepID=A0A5A9P5L0_9TELE|nr:TSC22 domain family protein 1 [Triplophysa tibetana]